MLSDLIKGFRDEYREIGGEIRQILLSRDAATDSSAHNFLEAGDPQSHYRSPTKRLLFAWTTIVDQSKSFRDLLQFFIPLVTTIMLYVLSFILLSIVISHYL